jgi:hypothetical protein
LNIEENSNSIEIDYIEAWTQASPFSYIKKIFNTTIKNDLDVLSEYPYDSMFNNLAARGLVIAASELNILIEVRYKWEVVDTTSIATHSMYGKVAAIDININDETRGFAIDGTELDMDIMAISYDRVFYVGHGAKP